MIIKCDFNYNLASLYHNDELTSNFERFCGFIYVLSIEFWLYVVCLVTVLILLHLVNDAIVYRSYIKYDLNYNFDMDIDENKMWSLFASASNETQELVFNVIRSEWEYAKSLVKDIFINMDKLLHEDEKLQHVYGLGIININNINGDIFCALLHFFVNQGQLNKNNIDKISKTSNTYSEIYNQLTSNNSVIDLLKQALYKLIKNKEIFCNQYIAQLINDCSSKYFYSFYSVTNVKDICDSMIDKLKNDKGDLFANLYVLICDMLPEGSQICDDLKKTLDKSGNKFLNQMFEVAFDYDLSNASCDKFEQYIGIDNIDVSELFMAIRIVNNVINNIEGYNVMDSDFDKFSAEDIKKYLNTLSNNVKFVSDILNKRFNSIVLTRKWFCSMFVDKFDRHISDKYSYLLQEHLYLRTLKMDKHISVSWILQFAIYLVPLILIPILVYLVDKDYYALNLVSIIGPNVSCVSTNILLDFSNNIKDYVELLLNTYVVGINVIIFVLQFNFWELYDNSYANTFIRFALISLVIIYVYLSNGTVIQYSDIYIDLSQNIQLSKKYIDSIQKLVLKIQDNIDASEYIILLICLLCFFVGVYCFYLYFYFDVLEFYEKKTSLEIYDFDISLLKKSLKNKKIRGLKYVLRTVTSTDKEELNKLLSSLLSDDIKDDVKNKKIQLLWTILDRGSLFLLEFIIMLVVVIISVLLKTKYFFNCSFVVDFFENFDIYSFIFKMPDQIANTQDIDEINTLELNIDQYILFAVPDYLGVDNAIKAFLSKFSYAMMMGDNKKMFDMVKNCLYEDIKQQLMDELANPNNVIFENVHLFIGYNYFQFQTEYTIITIDFEDLLITVRGESGTGKSILLKQLFAQLSHVGVKFNGIYSAFISDASKYLMPLFAADDSYFCKYFTLQQNFQIANSDFDPDNSDILDKSNMFAYNSKMDRKFGLIPFSTGQRARIEADFTLIAGEKLMNKNGLKLLGFDELFANLDGISRGKMAKLLSDEIKKIGAVCIGVDHSSELLKYSDVMLDINKINKSIDMFIKNNDNEFINVNDLNAGEYVMNGLNVSIVKKNNKLDDISINDEDDISTDDEGYISTYDEDDISINDEDDIYINE